MGEDEGELLLRGSAPDDACTGTLTTKGLDASPITMEFLVTSALAFVPGGDDACLGPQAALVECRMCLQIPPIFGARFLLHERDILLEWEKLPIEPLDGKLLDPRDVMPDVKLLLPRIHQAGDTLACQFSAEVVLLMIDGHAPIGLHRAGKGLPLHLLQPVIRVHHL